MVTVTKYVWDPVFDCVSHELDETNAVTAVYHNEPQQYGGVLSQRRGTTSHYHHHDALGSTRFLTDDTGAVTDTYVYDAWGNSVASTGATVNPFKWVGKYGYFTDNSTGQVYVRARMYQPTVGRWCSVDPLIYVSYAVTLPNMNVADVQSSVRGSTANLTQYAYVNQRPILQIDSSGLETNPCFPKNFCYCGPDVGSQLAATLKNAQKAFNKAGSLTQLWWCNNPALWLSWDLYDDCWERRGANGRCGTCCVGTAPDTACCVNVFGFKHNQWNVNYILWGAMAGLCHLSLSAARFYAGLHKEKKHVSGQSPCGHEATDTLFSWITAGYGAVSGHEAGVTRGPYVPLETGMPQYNDPTFDACIDCPNDYAKPSTPCAFRWFNNNDVRPGTE
jgi:RHS repeat-associated protein